MMKNRSVGSCQFLAFIEDDDCLQNFSGLILYYRQLENYLLE